MLLKEVQMQRVNWENNGDRLIQTTWAGGQSQRSKTTLRISQNLSEISVGKQEHEKVPVTEMARDILANHKIQRIQTFEPLLCFIFTMISLTTVRKSGRIVKDTLKSLVNALYLFLHLCFQNNGRDRNRSKNVSKEG